MRVGMLRIKNEKEILPWVTDMHRGKEPAVFLDTQLRASFNLDVEIAERTALFLADDAVNLLIIHKCHVNIETEAQKFSNVRELENAIERACVLCDGDEIKSKDLPSEICNAANGIHQTAPTAISDGARADAQTSYWQSLIQKRLDELEEAFPQALAISKKNRNITEEPNKNQVRLKDLGKALNRPCSHVVLSNFFNERLAWKKIPGPVRINIIASLAKEYPDLWPHLRNHCGRLKKHFQ